MAANATIDALPIPAAHQEAVDYETAKPVNKTAWQSFITFVWDS